VLTAAAGAAFGPAPTAAGLTGTVVLSNDGVGATTDACEPLVGFPAGSIAVVDRGTDQLQHLYVLESIE